MHLENPKGKVAFEKDFCYALSHEVEGFISLRDLIDQKGVDEVARCINEDEYKDFGKVLVYAICTKEFDLHTRNIGINKNKRFIKIDGDWALARLRLKVDGGSLLRGKFNITPEVITSLPLFPLPQVSLVGKHVTNDFDYMVYNHFDQFESGKLIQKDNQKFISKISSEFVRRDINIALLYFILYPTEYLSMISEHQSSNQCNADTVYLELLMNRLQVSKSALLDPEFCKFIKTMTEDDYNLYVVGFAHNLSQFKMSGKIYLGSVDEILDKVKIRFSIIKGVIKEEDYSVKWIEKFEALLDIKPSLTNLYQENSLNLAAEYGDAHLFKLLLKNGGDLDHKNSDGETPLIVAAGNGNIEIVKLILKKKNYDKVLINMSLQMATFGNHTLLAQELVRELRADVNAVFTAGVTSLLLAIQNANDTLFNIFRVHGASINVTTEDGLTTAVLAAKVGCLSILQKLYVLDKELIHSLSSNKESALLLAAKNGHESVVDYLLNLQCDPNQVDNRNRPPLFYAARNGNISLARKLLTVTSKIHLNAALHAASESGNLDIVKLLLIAGADINSPATTVQMYTPLILAARNNHPKVVKYLLSHPLLKNINQISSDGSTALIKAAQQKYWDCTYYLLNSDIKPDVLYRRPDGACAISLIAEAGELGYCANILDNYAISVEDANAAIRGSLLHMAIEKADRKALNALLDLNPDIEIISNRGESLLICAVRCGNAKVIALILDRVRPNEINMEIAYATAKIHNHTDIVDVIFKKYRQFNAKQANIKVLQPIHTAIEDSDIATLKRLCLSVANIRMLNDRSETPLIHAARLGAVAPVEAILAADATMINSRNIHGWTALTMAITHKKWDAAEFLLTVQGIDLSLAGYEDVSAFELCMNARNFKFCERLLQQGYDVNEELDQLTGLAPLHYAISEQDLEMVNFLLVHHADINKLVGKTKTPIMIALEMNDAAIVNALVQRGAVIRPEDSTRVEVLCHQVRDINFGMKKTHK